MSTGGKLHRQFPTRLAVGDDADERSAGRFQAVFLTRACVPSTLFHFSCLENPMDRAAWWATVHGGAKRRARLSDFTSLHSLVCPPCSSTHSKSVARRPQEMASNRLERSGVPEWRKDACPFPSLSLDWLVNKTSTSTISSH